MGVTSLSIGFAVYFMLYDQKFEFGMVKYTLTNSFVRLTVFSLPSFLHVIAFTFLILATYQSITLKNAINWSIFWGVLNSMFEYFQSYKNLLEKKYVPEYLANYFEHGTFDWLDMLSIWLGVLFAIIFIHLMKVCK